MILVLFDIDGTLLDSVAMYGRCFLGAFDAVGAPLVDSDWASYEHHSDGFIFPEAFRRAMGRDPSEEESRAFMGELGRNFRAGRDRGEAPPIAGAIELLATLRARGDVAFGFATGSARGSAEDKLRLLGLDPVAEALVTSSEYSQREDIVAATRAAVAERVGRDDFERVVSVGDGIWDLRAAQNLGFDFVGVGKGEGARKLIAAGALVVLEDFVGEDVMDTLLNSPS